MTKPRALTGNTSRALRLLSAALYLCLVAASTGWAQTSATDGKTPSGLAPGYPGGSYALSGFESVNLYGGGLSFRLPLKFVGGRGSAGYTVTLPIEQKWIVKTGQASPSGVVPLAPNPNWWQGIKPGYGPGVMHGRRAAHIDSASYTASEVLDQADLRTLTRLTFTGADGTEYELRDQATGGQPRVEAWHRSTGDRDGFSRGTVFVTADGSSATFISAADVLDYVSPNMAQSKRLFYPSGVLLLADGTRYAISGGVVASITDRNGNRVTFAYGTGSRVSSATDQLGRAVTFTYNDGVRGYDEITYKGFGGAARAVRVWYASLSARLRTGYALKTYHDLFPLNSASTTTQYNPSRVSEVELPDGRRYQLYYNPYGELARVELPTGGAFEYDWDGVTDPDNAVIFRHVAERRVYSSGTTPEQKTQYARTNASPDSVIEVSTRDGAGALLSRSRHYFYGDAFESMMEDPVRPSAISYGTWREGREYRTEEFAYDGTTIVRRVEQTWAQRAPVSWWTLAADLEPPNDPRVVQTVTTLVDTNQASKQTFSYDQYNNRTDVYDYDLGAGASGALIRRTHTDYVTAPAYVGAGATPSLGAHLRSLPSQTWVSSDAAGNSKVARTAYEYDNYSDAEGDARHDPLATYPDTGITGRDTAGYPATFTQRGNVTGVTSYADAAGQTGTVAVSTMYDIAGVPIKSVDARGNLSSVGYTDSFCNGAGCGGTYTAHTYAFATSMTSPIPDATGAYGSNTALTTSTKYDFWTGLVYSTTDANGQTTTFGYADALDRPTSQVRPDGSRTDVGYGDAVGNLYVRTLSDLDSTRRVEVRQHFDGMGRVVRSFSKEGQDSSNQWLTTDMQYDALGRVLRVSNQYRSAGPGSAVNPSGYWTTTAHDALGRVASVTTPDDPARGALPAGDPERHGPFDNDATSVTDYHGDKVMVTDQAGKRRISRTDALGRLTDVWELTAADAATVAVSFGGVAYNGYRTSYRYDASGNLRKVEQGAQSRFFAYDSLGRLVRAKHPEQGAMATDTDFPALTDSSSGTANSQWSLGYVYDAGGNVMKRKDARGVTAAYSYDALNRNTTVNYSDATPDVTRYYDGATLGRGRAWRSEASSKARTTVPEYDSMGRVKTYGQQFRANGAWGAFFGVSRLYNRAGHVTSQTYPSGRVATYTYDAAGRLAAFAGNLGDAVQRTYASEVRYHEMGGVEQERYGMTTPVYSKRFYNVRGQLAEVRVSTTSILAASPGNSNRGAILNVYSALAGWTESGKDNNGNLRKQMVYVPNDDAISGWWETAFFYDYDALNRLTQSREVRSGQNYWVQHFNYDRWGNRTINAANTTNAPEPQFTASSASNRLSAPAGYTMAYDTAGNLINDTYTGAGTRSYDAEGRLTSAQFFSGQLQTAAYAYDADGKRVKRGLGAGGEVWQVYGIDGELLAEYTPNASPASPLKEYGYRAGGLLVTAEPGAQVRWLITDHLGTPRMVLNRTGSLAGVTRHDYLAFGEALTGDAAGRTAGRGYAGDGVRQRFTGHERDDETNLDYAQARYYANASGRFTSPDPFGPWAMSDEEKLRFMIVPQQWNRYSYVTNNPLKYVDPDGLLRFDNSVTPDQQKLILDSLKNIQQNGTAKQRELATFLLENDVLLSVETNPGRLFDARTDFADSESGYANTQRAIDGGPLTMSKAAGLVSITLLESRIKKDGYGAVGLEGLLVHEGQHALDLARVAQGLSDSAGPNAGFDPTQFTFERTAFVAEAEYLMRSNLGIQLGRSTKLLEAIARPGAPAGIGVNEIGIRRILISPERPYHISVHKPGPRRTDSTGLRPRARQ